MNSPTDQQLLRDYAGHRSEAAFAEIVRRHVDFVYSAALRMVGDAHLAADVTQGAFVALAGNARQIADRSVLSGWLHRTAQNLAANTVRSEVRRRAREKEAAAMNQLLANESDAVWEDVAPHLDTALGELSEGDRDAVLLRYFEKKSAAEMSQILGISDEAAQKRVSRAVEKLREFFSKEKITVGASGLAVLISANAVQSAPVGLVAAISAAAFAGTAAVSTSTAVATTKIIAMTTLQKTLVTATVAVLAGAGIYQAKQTHDARAEAQKLQQEQVPLVAQIQQLQNNFADATNRLVNLLAENSRLKSNPNQTELLRLRGEVGVLKNQVDEAGRRATAAETKFKEAVSAQAQFQAHQVALMNATKQLGLASRMFMHDNANQYPTNDLQFKKYLIGKLRDGTLNFRDIEFGSFEFMANATTGAAAPNAMEFRERLARQAPDGTWQRVYGFADGSVQTATSNDGNFDAWEKVNTYSPATNQ